MKNTIFLSCLCLILLAGCVETIRYEHKGVENWKLFDPNDYGIKISKKEEGSIYYHWNLDVEFDEQKSTIPLWNKNLFIPKFPVTRGILNNKTYPVIFDTGCYPNILVQDVHINENEMPVFFLKPHDKPSSGGLAIAESLNVGPLRFENYPCLFWHYQAEVKFLGLPSGISKSIILPLDLMSQFKYIEFNRIDNTITLSEKYSYKSQKLSQWLSYPFKMDKSLYLTITVEGIETKLMLDTGSNGQIKLDKNIIEQLYLRKPELKNARKKKTITHVPYAGGKKIGRKFTASDIQFGDAILKKVNITYIKDAYKNLSFKGTIGFGLFENTVMVLDFENNIMWIKKSGKFL
jgi:hypothetical protein